MAEAEIIDFEGVEPAAAVLKYNGHRLNYRLNFDKATAIDGHLATGFVAELQRDLEVCLTRAEAQLSKCNQCSAFLTQENHARAAVIAAEVEANRVATAALWTALFARKQERGAAQPAVAPAAPAPQVVRPVDALRPAPLCHDASTSDLTLWKRQFRAYYDTSNLAAANLQNQQAYFLNCLDQDLGKIISRQTAPADPLFGAAPSLVSKIEEFFRRRHPPLLRRQNFFRLKQQAGQGAREFLESLRSAADEADIAAMRVEDALCVQLVSGLSDMKLVEKLTEVENPTIDRFVTVVDSYMHAHSASTAVGAAAQAKSGRKTNQQQQQRQSAGGGQRRQPISEEEKKRRQSLFGKCFRCGSADHQGRDCKHARDVVCNKCRQPGHVSPACGQAAQPRQARQVTANEDAHSSVSSYQPAQQLGAPYYYMPPDYASAAGPPQAQAQAVTAATASRATPKCNL